jgi:hypothetical protein
MRNICEKYKKQLTDEKLTPKKTASGTEIMEWKDSGNNHLGDVEKYLLAAIDLVVQFLRAKNRESAGQEGEPKPESDETGMTVLEEQPRIMAHAPTLHGLW